MKRLMLTAAVVSFAAPAAADEYCERAEVVMQTLKSQSDHVAMMGNIQVGVVFHVFALRDGQWIMVAVSDGVACLVGKGEVSVFKGMGEPA